MEIINIVSKIITTINRGFDIIETVLKIANEKSTKNSSDKNK